MLSRETGNDGPSMRCPTSISALVVMGASSHRPDGLATTRADDLPLLVEKHVIVHDEQPILPDELVERTRLQSNGIAGPRRDVVAPGLAGIDGARTAHP